MCGACRAAGADVEALLLSHGLCQYQREVSDVVKFVSVVWPRAMNFLNQLKESIFLFTVSGSETTTKLSV